MSITKQLHQTFQEALAAALGPDFAEADPIIRPAQDPQFGDYQANCAMGLAKRLKQKPRDIAQRIIEEADLDHLCEPPEVAGPGFINLRLKPEFINGRLAAIVSEDRLGVPLAEPRQRVVVDFSAPNLAKEMHVGHLRTTVIGDAVARVLEFGGHDVLRISHVGDWGTQFGMLIQHLRETAPEALASDQPVELADLDEFYPQAKQRFDQDGAFRDAARRAVVDLQAGDPATVTAWRSFCGESSRHAADIYRRMDVRLIEQGESFYNDMLPVIVKDLAEAGLAVESEGAICVFIEGFKAKDGSPLPMIVRKSDGGYNYDTTDFAALRHRVDVDRADRIIYVVDARQALHFQMLFQAARKAGWAPERVALEHVGFGMVLGKDGRPIKTREGGTIKLRDLLVEGVARAREIVDGNSADLPEDQRAEIAEAVGIGAVKYADLSQNRTSDYRFDWDKLLALEGNTAPYMMYAYARVRSIGREGAVDWEAVRADSELGLADPHELALGKKILQFPDVIEAVAEELKPNILTDYLYDLARSYSRFYENCPVLKATDAATRDSRLRLCDLTARTLRRGLDLLGIRTVEQM